MPKTAKTPVVLQQFHRFESTRGPIDFIMDAPGRYRLYHGCSPVNAKTASEQARYEDVRSGEMHFMYSGENLAMLFCPRCGRHREFTWPASETPTFGDLIEAIQQGASPPNILF